MAYLEADLGVIKDARRRQRRRRAAIGAGLLVAALVAVLAATQTRQTSPPVPTSPDASFSAPGRVFSRSPYMGVACPVANSVACDRVGLAVWLRRPAVSLSATIAGAPLKLNWAGDRSPGFALRHDRTPRTAFDGYLRPAGIVTRLHVTPESSKSRWLGGNAPSPLVHFRITYSGGRVVVTREHVPLAAGWG